MTCLTLRIVACGLDGNLVMRIVTRHATDARVTAIETLTICQSVRLKPNVDLPEEPIADNVRKTPMALAAEVRHVFCTDTRQLCRHRLELAARYPLRVRIRPRVASFALDAANQ